MVEYTININANVSQVIGALDKVHNNLNQIDKKARETSLSLRGAFQAIGARALVGEFFALSDSFTRATNRLRVVEGSAAGAAGRLEALTDIAERSRTSLTATTAVYSRLALNVEQFRGNAGAALDFTELLNKSFKAFGLTSREIDSVLVQLTQALAAGKLQGDEFRTVMESFPPLARIIAKEMGVSTASLQRLRTEGKITSDIIVKGIFNARQEIEGKFAKTIPTIEEQMVVLGNSTQVLIGKLTLLEDGANGVGTAFSALNETVKALTAGVQAFQEIGGKGLRQANDETENLARQGGASLTFYTEKIAELERQLRILENGATTTFSKIQHAGGSLALPNLGATPGFGGPAKSADSKKQADSIRAQLERYRKDLDATRAKIMINADEEQKAAAARARLAAEAATAKQQKALDGIIAKLIRERQEYELIASVSQEQLPLLREALSIQEQIAKNQIPVTPERIKALQLLALETDRARQRAAVQEELNKPLKEELTILDLKLRGLNEEAAIQQQLFQLKEKGVKVTAEEENKTRALYDTRQLLLAQESVFGDAQQAQAQIRALELLKNAYKTNEEALEAINRKQDEVRLRGLESATSLAAGYERAFLKMKLESTNFASALEAGFTSLADNLTDALATFAETGKLSFKDLARSILSDLTRILARLIVVQALTAALGGAGSVLGIGLGGAASLSGRAKGGAVGLGQSVMVGERGPEIFTPATAGVITPAVGASPSPPLNVQVVNVTDPKDVPRAISTGGSDEAILNVLSRNRSRVRSLVG